MTLDVGRDIKLLQATNQQTIPNYGYICHAPTMPTVDAAWLITGSFDMVEAYRAIIRNTQAGASSIQQSRIMPGGDWATACQESQRWLTTII